MLVVFLGVAVMIISGFAMIIQEKMKEPYSMIDAILHILMFIGAAIVVIGDKMK